MGNLPSLECSLYFSLYSLSPHTQSYMHAHEYTHTYTHTYQVEIVKDLRGPLHLPQNPEHLLVEKTTVVLEVHTHFLLQQQSQLLTGHLLKVLVEHHLTKLRRQDLLQRLALTVPTPGGRNGESATYTSLFEECEGL